MLVLPQRQRQRQLHDFWFQGEKKLKDVTYFIPPEIEKPYDIISRLQGNRWGIGQRPRPDVYNWALSHELAGSGNVTICWRVKAMFVKHPEQIGGP